MEIGTCRYCVQPNKELAESHLMPGALYDLCEVNGEFVMATSKSVSFTGRHLKHPLLCVPCDGSLSVNGENWVLPFLATLEGTFPFFDLLTKIPPDVVDGDVRAFAVSRNPEIDWQKLAHFAMGIFWKASVHSWRRGEIEPQIDLGPYREEIRRFLRSEGPFPRYAALTIGVIPKPVKEISFTQPYRGSVREYHHFVFHVPGVVFTLSVGKQIGAAKTTCFYSHPLHPIIVGNNLGGVKGVMREATKNAHISKRIAEELLRRM